MKKITIGILAHVDAGKTTLSEAMLYKSGAIKSVGRVDHQNAFLDTDAQERARGITIFSKQARFSYEATEFVLLDTPGHVDFSAEMERTLQVLDYAILVISGKDGVQGHTATLWKLLRKYRVPVFIFVNKMDMEGAYRNVILNGLRKKLDQSCIDFTAVRDDEWFDQVAMCDEILMDNFLENGYVDDKNISDAIKNRNLFPCYFGSALKIDGVEELLAGMDKMTAADKYGEQFGARVFKITRDNQGNRLTHMKITGGNLHTKDMIEGEKVEQIRSYSGSKFKALDVAAAGDVCAVTGLKNTFAGQGLGTEVNAEGPILESVLVYQAILPPEIDVHVAFTKLKQLEEEDPQLKIIWNEQLQEIQMQLMGEVQTEILKTVIKDRFGYDIDFGQGNITYKETIAEPVAGAGHFEPLRHYAEVHLLLEPGERGSGLVFDSKCSEDILDKNWQRLIMGHLSEKEHIGVLTGSPITDIKISILTGRAHLKHTEGGDFRQATYRAIRQGLRKAESILLEPWYEFIMEIPSGNVGRAMADIQRMGGNFNEPENLGETTVLTGKAPVSEMKDYTLELVSYTKGYGRLSCSLCGYEACHNQKQVVDEIAYDPDRDIANTADSVFCYHGAGETVSWEEADDHMHMESNWPPNEEKEEFTYIRSSGGYTYGGTKEEDAELDRIFERTYGKPKQRSFIGKREILSEAERVKIQPAKVMEEYLLVDGYNIIFAWEQLRELAKVNIDAAREALIEILSNYQGFRKCHVIAVFDAYRVKGGERRFEKYDNVDVVYTKEAETADMYIEKTAHEKSKGKDNLVRVATSDRLEQLIIVGGGAFKMSADELKLEIQQADEEIAKYIETLNRRNKLENRNGINILIDEKES